MKNNEHSDDEVLRNQNHFPHVICTHCDLYALSYSGRKLGVGKTTPLSGQLYHDFKTFFVLFCFSVLFFAFL